MATSYSTASVGGGNSGTTITGGTIGEIFFATTPSNSGSLTQNEKICYVNDSTTDNAIAVIFWVDNAIAAIPSFNTLSVQSTSALDVGVFLRVTGFDNSGNPITIDVTVTGVTLSTSGSSMATVSRAVLLNTSTLQPTASYGTITLKSGTTAIANLNPGYKSMTGECKIGVAATLNDTATISNCTSTPPCTLFLAQGVGNALSAAAGGTIPYNSGSGNQYQSVWCSLVTAELAVGSPDCQFIVAGQSNLGG